MKTLNQVIARVLDAQPALKEALSTLAGKSILLVLVGPAVSLQCTITQTGLIFRQAEADASADAKMTGSPLALLAACGQGDHPLVKSVQYSGDIETALAVRRVLSRVHIDLEAILAEYVGDAPADLIGRAVRASRQIGGEVAQRLLDQSEAYLKQEIEVGVEPAEFEVFAQQVRALRDGVERAEARIKVLEDHA